MLKYAVEFAKELVRVNSTFLCEISWICGNSTLIRNNQQILKIKIVFFNTLFMSNFYSIAHK